MTILAKSRIFNNKSIYQFNKKKGAFSNVLKNQGVHVSLKTFFLFTLVHFFLPKMFDLLISIIEMTKSVFDKPNHNFITLVFFSTKRL